MKDRHNTDNPSKAENEGRAARGRRLVVGYWDMHPDFRNEAIIDLDAGESTPADRLEAFFARRKSDDSVKSLFGDMLADLMHYTEECFGRRFFDECLVDARDNFRSEVFEADVIELDNGGAVEA